VHYASSDTAAVSDTSLTDTTPTWWGSEHESGVAGFCETPTEKRGALQQVKPPENWARALNRADYRGEGLNRAGGDWAPRTLKDRQQRARKAPDQNASSE